MFPPPKYFPPPTRDPQNPLMSQILLPRPQLVLNHPFLRWRTTVQPPLSPPLSLYPLTYNYRPLSNPLQSLSPESFHVTR